MFVLRWAKRMSTNLNCVCWRSLQGSHALGKQESRAERLDSVVLVIGDAEILMEPKTHETSVPQSDDMAM